MSKEKMDILKKQYPDDIHGAKVIQVIQSKTLVGNGTEERPWTIVTLYRSLDGDLLAVYDPRIEES